MSPEGEAYLQIVEALRPETPRDRVIELSAKADAIWRLLGETEQAEIERHLIATEAKKEIP